MRIVLYVHHSLFEPALSLVDALSPSAEVHVLLEVPAEQRPIADFEAWRGAASFHVVPTGRRLRDRPKAFLTTLVALRRIRAIQADVLHVDDVDVSPRLALALAIVGPPCPTLVGCHDPEPHSGERHWGRKHLARLLAFARAHAVLVHHAAGRSAVHRRHPRLSKPVHMVRIGTYAFLREQALTTRSPKERRPGGDLGGSPPAGPTVLLFGRITPYKGVEGLFEAAPRVAGEVPGVRFVVAGSPVAGYQPPDPPRLGNGGSIETHYEYVPHDRLAALFDAADVVACPYTDASQSGVVLTSYAFGCPVVATDAGGLPEYVSDGTTGLVVPVGDVQALAAALVACLTDAELSARLRRGVAAANTGDLSWRRVAAEMSEVYTEVARSASPS